jgi:hypothetical protein
MTVPRLMSPMTAPRPLPTSTTATSARKLCRGPCRPAHRHQGNGGARCARGPRPGRWSPSHPLATGADASGAVSWTWEIGPSTRPGPGSVVVTCNGTSARSPIEID